MSEAPQMNHGTNDIHKNGNGYHKPGITSDIRMKEPAPSPVPEERRTPRPMTHRPKRTFQSPEDYFEMITPMKHEGQRRALYNQPQPARRRQQVLTEQDLQQLLLARHLCLTELAELETKRSEHMLEGHEVMRVRELKDSLVKLGMIIGAFHPSSKTAIEKSTTDKGRIFRYELRTHTDWKFNPLGAEERLTSEGKRHDTRRRRKEAALYQRPSAVRAKTQAPRKRAKLKIVRNPRAEINAYLRWAEKPEIGENPYWMENIINKTMRELRYRDMQDDDDETGEERLNA